MEPRLKSSFWKGLRANLAVATGMVMLSLCATGCQSDPFVIHADPNADFCSKMVLAVDNSAFRSDTTGTQTRMDADALLALLTTRENMMEAIDQGTPVLARYYKRAGNVDKEITAEEFPFVWAFDGRHVQTEGMFLVTIGGADKTEIAFQCKPCVQVDTAGNLQPIDGEVGIQFEFVKETEQKSEHLAFAMVPRAGITTAAGDQYIVQIMAPSSYAEWVKERLKVEFVNEMFHVSYHDPLRTRSLNLLNRLVEVAVIDDLRQAYERTDRTLAAIVAQLDSLEAAMAKEGISIIPQDSNRSAAPEARSLEELSDLSELRATSKRDAEESKRALELHVHTTNAQWTLLMEKKIALQLERAAVMPRLKLFRPADACE